MLVHGHFAVVVGVLIGLSIGCGGDDDASPSGSGGGEGGSSMATQTEVTGSDSASSTTVDESSSNASSTGEPSTCTEVHTGDLELDGQANVDAMSGLREVTGVLTITGDVQNLEALGCLSTVGGSLQIDRTTNLHNLSGLADLSDLGGGMEVTNNAELSSLDGLESLRFVPRIYLRSNALTSLGLSHLQATDTIRIGDCGGADAGEPELTDLAGLESLLALGRVEVYRATALAELSGLEAFADRGGSLGSLKLWFNSGLDPEVITNLADRFDSLHVETCGNLGESAEDCFCPPPP